jgi:hypothetical protein
MVRFPLVSPHSGNGQLQGGNAIWSREWLAAPPLVLLPRQEERNIETARLLRFESLYIVMPLIRLPPSSPWVQYYDEGAERFFWYNNDTDETHWGATQPATPVNRL